jgi:hypothetical protein
MVADSLFGVVSDGDVHAGIGIFHEKPVRFRFCSGRTVPPGVLAEE